MEKILIHISDIHFKQNIQENQQKVLDAFFDDLKIQIKDADPSDVFFILSGDIVYNGESKDDFNAAKSYLEQNLDALRICKDNRICVPGNHDISRSVIVDNKFEHTALCQRNWSEQDFNDCVSEPKPSLFSKFQNYNKFKSEFAHSGVDDKTPTISQYSISDNITIYSINSAILSCAGLDGHVDEEKLCIDTRLLNELLSKDDSNCKIAIMHHHYSLLSSWCRKEFSSILRTKIKLSLAGHTHEQDVHHVNCSNNGGYYIDSVNPQLFSDKHDKLGYSIIYIYNDNVKEIKFRQWNLKFNRFVSGVDFSGTDSGIVQFSKIDQGAERLDNRISILENRLDDAMRAYSDREHIWLNRRLSKSRESYINLKHSRLNDISLLDIAQNPRNIFVQAPAEFGLTCLSHYMVNYAWKNFSKFWLRIDLDDLRLKDVERHINSECSIFSKKESDISCVIIDSWREQTTENVKIVDKIKKRFDKCPIIIMRTIEPNQIIGKETPEELVDHNEVIHLLPLDRNDIRALKEYEDITEDEDSLVARITSDLEVLNMHRTPLNCFTLLAASNIDHTTIVNRTTLIERVLQILFEDDTLPQYMTKPDVKDCEYVLGFFCEDLIKNNSYIFTKKDFDLFVKQVCEPNHLEIDSNSLFTILVDNSIIYTVGSKFKFRHSFWIYYFAARRMIDSQDFAEYIFKTKKYVDFPEIIEFYTGLDRKRNDALSVLVKDVEASCNKVCDKMGTTISMIPYDSLKWSPNAKFIEQVKQDFSDDVQQSTLPKEIKDKYADSNYNPAKPFSQDVDTILSDYFVLILMRDIRAASMALRNSDYADGELKREIINRIVRAWEQVSQIIVALSPILATNGAAGCGGASFVLSGDFGDNFDEKIKQIILKIPENIINWFQNDISSHKLGPLFNNNMENEDNKFNKHLMALLIVQVRPNNWKDSILTYIKSLHKNSYYLYDLFSALNIQYSYSFADRKDLNTIAFLIKACVAKHDTGVELPGINTIKKVSNDVLPERSID